VEGTLITVAGIVIIYESIQGLLHPKTLHQLDYGILLIALTALVNFTVGYVSIKKGKKNNSLALIASGKHLQSDTYTTLGIIVGLILIYFTGINWLDSIVAIVFALFIMYTGYKIVRSSIAGIMDEADTEILEKMVNEMNKERQPNWVDFHNLRVIKYGGHLHVDAHVTVPWYFNIHEAHNEIDRFGRIIRTHFGDSLEMFVHTDGCLYHQCSLCFKENCPVRKLKFKHRVEWTLENVLSNEKHSLEKKGGRDEVEKGGS
jgi:cation diffusion facilitator family transporter